ncbi:MAG TPA: DNA-binding domain-containing protein [Candidatus Polarisedimenticolia bacterium]|nr:DNA-binding domain-containing protein [Candidatus Polarisedimenticolia bacterium]
MQALPSPDGSRSMDLYSTQARLLGAMSAGQDILGQSVERLFLEPAGESVAARWNIYAEGYLLRLAEAIGNDYPAIRRIAGHWAFVQLCRRYLSAFPPSSFDIGRAGAALAIYLPSDAASGSLPFLPDLARFEWALAEAVVARDVVPLTWSDVKACGADRFTDLPLVATPGTAIVRSIWPLSDLRIAKDKKDDEIDIVLEGRSTTLIIWRHGLEPRWVAASEDQAALAEGALSRTTPARLLETGAFGAGKDAPLRLVAALGRIVELGILAPPSEEERS